MRTVRDLGASWERLLAVLLTAAAGFLVAQHPAPSIDRLLDGYPATLALGLILGVGAVLNLLGLIRPSYSLQRVGLVMQVPPLVLFAIALSVVTASAGLAYAFLLLALACRTVGQYRRLGRRYEVAKALTEAGVLPEEPREPA